MSAVRWSVPFEELAVGQSFTTRPRIVTEADLVAFSALTGDWHPQHSDAEWAASSRFGERIAHGMLIVSFAVGLVPFDPERVVALRRIGEVVFKRPVAIGESIRVDGKLASLSELDAELGLVRWAWSLCNERDALVARAHVDVLWRRRAAQPPDAAEPAEGNAHEYAAGVFPC